MFEISFTPRVNPWMSVDWSTVNNINSRQQDAGNELVRTHVEDIWNVRSQTPSNIASRSWP